MQTRRGTEWVSGGEEGRGGGEEEEEEEECNATRMTTGQERDDRGRIPLAFQRASFSIPFLLLYEYSNVNVAQRSVRFNANLSKS